MAAPLIAARRVLHKGVVYQPGQELPEDAPREGLLRTGAAREKPAYAPKASTRGKS